MARVSKKSGRESSKISVVAESISDTKTEDGFACSGNFLKDFNELCHLNNYTYIPLVVQRTKILISSESQLTAIPEEKLDKKLSAKNKQISVDDNQIKELSITADLPKTYKVQEFKSYFMPSVQVISEMPDKLDIISEIYIRGWKLDEKMLGIFKQCFALQNTLHTINFWRVALNDETINIFTDIISEMPSLKYISLDNNDSKLENWGYLIEKPSFVQHISLRYCNINDIGAETIGKAIGNIKAQNSKLLSLDLTGNKIGDAGAAELAKGLRYNRSLIYLNLENNYIGNDGVKCLAESISKMQLTHEEIVTRRRFILETLEPSNLPVEVEESVSSSTINSTTKVKSGRTSKKEIKSTKEEEKNKSKTKEASAKAIVRSDVSLKKSSAKKNKESESVTETVSENLDNLHPLMNQSEVTQNGLILVKGNLVLTYLNLSNNSLNEKGVEYLLRALQYQQSFRAPVVAKQLGESASNATSQSDVQNVPNVSNKSDVSRSSATIKTSAKASSIEAGKLESQSTVNVPIKNFGLRVLKLKGNHINPENEYFLELKAILASIEESFPIF